MADLTTIADIANWPLTVDVPTAARAFGISRSYAYELANSGEFPAKVIKVGTRFRVVSASVLAVLDGAAA